MHIEARLVNGEVIELNVESNRCVIGRSSKCDVVIPHEGMSRLHCQIEFIDGEYFVTDLGSTNGVLIDNQKIEPHQKIPYQTFLPLSFGAVQSLIITEEASSSRIQTTFARSSEESPSSGLTRTKTLKTPARPAPQSSENITRPDLKSEKIAKLRLWITSAVGVLLIASVAIWYVYQEQEAANEGFELMNKDVSEIEEKPYDQF